MSINGSRPAENPPDDGNKLVMLNGIGLPVFRDGATAFLYFLFFRRADKIRRVVGVAAAFIFSDLRIGTERASHCQFACRA